MAKDNKKKPHNEPIKDGFKTFFNRYAWPTQKPNMPDIQTLFQDHMTARRHVLSALIKRQDMSPAHLDLLFQGFENNASLRAEIEKAKLALLMGRATTPPDLSSEEKQFVWAAVLGIVHSTPEMTQNWGLEPNKDGTPVPIAKSILWRQLTGSLRAKKELYATINNANTATRDSNKISWGKMGGGTHYLPSSKLLRIDLMEALTAGLGHYRSRTMDKIGQGLLVQSYPDHMVYLQKQIKRIKNIQTTLEKQGKKLDRENYKNLRRFNLEWQLYNLFTMGAQAATTHQNSSEMASNSYQDFDFSLNNLAATIDGLRLKNNNDQTNTASNDAVAAFFKLVDVMKYSYQQKNGLFEDNLDGWHGINMHPEDIRRRRKAGGQTPSEHDYLDLLGALHDKNNGLRFLKPDFDDLIQGFDYFMAQAGSTNKKRNAIIEKLWDDFAKHHVDAIIKQEMDKLEEEMDQAQDQEQDGEPENGDDGQEGDGQDGEDQDGEPQDGDPQPGEGQKGDGQGKPDPNAQPDPNAKPDNQQPQNSDNNGDNEGDSDDNDTADHVDSGDNTESGEKSDQDGEYDQELNQGQGDDTTDVDGVGEMPDIDTPSETPEEQAKEMSQENSQDGDGQDADGQASDGESSDGLDDDGQDSDGEEGQSADDLADEISDMEADQAGQDADGQDADGEGDGDGDGDGEGQDSDKPGKPSDKKSDKAGKNKGRDDVPIVTDGWDRYMEQMSRLSSAISAAQKGMVKLKEAQLKRQTIRSKQMTLIPKAGEVDRLNLDKHRDLVVRKMTGQNIEKKHLERFHDDETSMSPAPVDIVLLVDGSGSMGMGSYQDAKGNIPIDVALTTAAILYEASRRLEGINVYVGMWGDSIVRWFAEPNDPRNKVGENFQRFKKGLNSGTNLGPAIIDTAKMLANKKVNAGDISGYTHIVVLSDGDISDSFKTKQAIETFLEQSREVTIDFSIIKTNAQDTAMYKMAQSIETKRPIQKIDITHSNNYQEIPLAIVKLLFKKIRQSGSFVAKSAKNKKSAARRAYNRMRP